MKKGIPFLILFSWLSYSTAFTQQAFEKVYLQTDRDYYAAGETIHFKGFVLSGDSLISTHLFVELWDSSFNKMASVCLPVIDATVSGSLSIPVKEYRGSVLLRAFTEKMEVQRSPFQFIKHVLNLGDKDPEVYNSQANISDPTFFPEGGTLLYNAMNHIAFKADPSFSGVIKNSRGDQVAILKPVFNGMGIFKFRPVKGQAYYCHWSSNGKEEVTSLPAPVENGVAIHTSQRNDTLFFEMDIAGSTSPALQKPRVQLMINNEIAYLIDLAMNGNTRFNHFIPLRAFQPSLAIFNVLDENMKAVVKRPLFISRKSLENTTELKVLQKEVQKRGTNKIQLNFKDTLLSEVSVSITDADYNWETARPGLVSLLLPPGLSKVFESGSNDAPVNNLDLALLTMDTIDWKKTGIEIPVSMGSNYLQLTGIVKTGKKPAANKELLVALRSPHTGREMYKVITDAEGKFVLDGLILYGEVFVHCRLTGKASEELTYEFKLDLPLVKNEQSFFESFKQSAISLFRESNRTQNVNVNRIDTSSRTDSIIFSEKGIMLKEVVVKADLKRQAMKKLAELEHKYLAGTGFAGYSSQAETVDVLNDPFAHKSTSLAAYIAAKFHMIKVKYSTGRPEYFYPIRAIGGDTIIRTFYLNGNKIPSSMVNDLRLEDIALIKFFPMLGMEFGLPPAIAFFYKKPGDYGEWETEKLKIVEKRIEGYPVTRNLEMPDYSKSEIKVEKDTRKTLLWQPYTKVENGIAEIRFYNNDVTKKIRIVAEGITREGKIVFFEKIIE